jgi:ubiquinol-cytochrome c reductase cytochrome c subunit
MRTLLVALGLFLLTGTAAAGTRGEQLYGQYCAACHGLNGEPTTIGGGPGRDQTQQQVIAPPLFDVGALAADFYLRTGYMPLPEAGSQPKRRRVRFDEGEIRALVRYVASLGGGPAIPHPHPERGDISRGQALFTDHCAGCHQIAGAGGVVTGAVPPPLYDATPTQIAEAVRIGPYVMPRFSARALPNHDLDSLIAYVEYAKHPDDPGGLALGHLGPVPEGLVAWLVAGSVLVAVCVVIGERLRRRA